MSLTVGSLFSGIGGIDLGLERAGMTVRWQSEIDPYSSRVLAKHWPTVPNLGDVTTIEWSEVEPVDLICGGYPCQPFSLAGARRGEDDARHLWPYMLAAIRALRPRFALLENVPGHLSMGFGRVLGDLAESGYVAEWDCIPASAVGAPHRRDRVFVVAHAQRSELRQQPVLLRGGSGKTVARNDGAQGTLADAQGDSGRGSILAADSGRSRQPMRAGVGASGGTGRGDPTPGTVVDRRGPTIVACDVADPDYAGRGQQRWTEPGRPQLPAAELGGWWEVEPDVGRVANGVPSRVDRLRGLGNAVVPQVAEFIGRRILAVAA